MGLAGALADPPARGNALVKQLSDLHSRFAPIPVAANTDLRPFGLDHPSVDVIVWADNKKYRLSIGEEPAESNSFTPHRPISASPRRRTAH